MRFAALDALRGICALVVIVYHVEVIGAIYAGSLHGIPFFEHGFLFVDFFFVLSGFVLTHTYFSKITATHELLPFIIRRFGRVYPLHLFFLILFVGIELVKLYAYSKGVHANQAPFESPYSVSSIFTNILLVQSLNVDTSTTWNSPSWSISVEFYTYVIFSVCALVSRGRRGLFVAISTCAACFGAYMVYFHSKDYMATTFDYGIFRCMYGFFFGSITYLGMIKMRRKVIAPAWIFSVFEAVTALGCIWFVSGIGDEPLSLLAPLVFSIAVAVFSFERGWISLLLTKRLFQNCGEISYTLYISHAFILVMVGRIFRVLQQKTEYFSTVQYHQMDLVMPTSSGVANLVVLGILMSIVALSVVVNRWLEIPCRDYFGRVAGRFQRGRLTSLSTEFVSSERRWLLPSVAPRSRH